MSIFDSKRDVRRDVKPQYIKLWLPCGIFSVLGTFIKPTFIFALLVLGAWLLAAGMTSESVKSWEQVRDDKLYADVADQDKFIQFTLGGNLVEHLVFVCAIGAIDVTLFIFLKYIDNFSFIAMGLFLLILTVSQYYFLMAVGQFCETLKARITTQTGATISRELPLQKHINSTVKSKRNPQDSGRKTRLRKRPKKRGRQRKRREPMRNCKKHAKPAKRHGLHVLQSMSAIRSLAEKRSGSG